ncbi:MAG: hypothetical protein AAFY71_23875 [Bacteroidota bacterium]
MKFYTNTSLKIIITALLAVVLVAFGCQTGSTTQSSTTEEKKGMTENSSEEGKEATAGESEEANEAEGEGEGETDAEEAPVNVGNADMGDMDAIMIKCGGSAMSLANPLMDIANRLEAQNLMYDTEPFTDCSGIFHRVLDSIEKRCPDHLFPDPAQYRSSRGVGKWYDENNNYIVVRDPVAAASYIKPGAVMFYAGSSVDPKTIEKDALFKQGGIRHVGVVVDVKTDDEGVIQSYTLFHGRTTGKVAAKTSYHALKPSRSNYPPYGNGRDHWVGVASIASDKLMK